MIVYRLARSQFKNDLSGTGAYLAGGRWNSAGIHVLYTASSRALCALEVAVHTALNVVPKDYLMIAIEMPDDKAGGNEIFVKDLPAHWISFPEIKFTQALGDRFFMEGKHLFLKVPSAVVSGDHNILVNPIHKDFGKVKVLSIEPFEFDVRLFIKEAMA